MNSGKIKVSSRVYRGIEALRHSGKADMMNQPEVIVLARHLGFEETARYIEDHKREYAAGILVRGFEADPSLETKDDRGGADER